ncbi:helix-turn-helix transcriptional regulator [Sphaerisporangium dianthi]|uniref:AAA family ATPase n=1 Tax=Sphaerisporangium dianthi TaxID=1436120 RepID=A0ABV9CJC7_9ACTN
MSTICGRTSEIDALGRLLDTAKGGRSGVLVLCGEAGMGKTVLLDFARAHADGLRVVSIAGVETERHIPFAGISQLVLPATDLLDRLPTSQATAMRAALALGPAVSPDRFAICVAMLNLFSVMAEEGPLLVTIDDLHWLDDSSAEAIVFAARRLVSEGIALLAATRESNGGMLGTARLPVMSLAPFDERAAAQLITGLTRIAPDPRLVERLVASTGGNPMAIREVLDGMTAGQLRGHQTSPDFTPARNTATALFATRVANLDEQERTLLLLMSLATGGDIDPVLNAAEILGVPTEALDGLEASGLVRIDGDRFVLSHPLVRSATMASFAPGRHRAVHRLLAAALTDPQYADRRTWHLAEATVGTDERVAEALDQLGGRAVARGGHAIAATAFERAARLSRIDRDRARRLHSAGAAAHFAGQYAKARELLDRSAALSTDPILDADIVAVRSRIEFFSGHATRAYLLLQRTAGQVREIDRSRAAALYVDAAMSALLAGDVVTAFETAHEAEVLGDSGGSVGLVTKVITGLGMLHIGQLSEGALKLAEASAIALGRTSERPADEYVVLTGLGMMWIGEHEQARPIIGALIERMRREGTVSWLPFALYVMTYIEARCGRLRDAHAMATEAVELARLTMADFSLYLALSALAYTEAVLGEEASCRRHVAEALALIPADADFPRDAVEALGLLELGLGHLDAAVNAFASPYAQPRGDTGRIAESHPDQLEALVRAGRVLPPDTLAENDERCALTGLPLTAAIAWRLRGLMAGDAEMETCFETALRLHDQVRCAFETARTNLYFGERLRRTGQRKRARHCLHAALRIFDEYGCRPWSRRARAELAATGESLREETPLSRLEVLTPQEYQVARAVSTGVTNQQVASSLFISTKTVEFHLGNVFRKLGVHSRTELAGRFPSLAE